MHINAKQKVKVYNKSKYYLDFVGMGDFYYNPRATELLQIPQQSEVGYYDKEQSCNQNQAATQFPLHRADGVYIIHSWQSAVFVFLVCTVRLY